MSTLFGVPIQIPDSWEDRSLYRFVVPRDAGLAVRMRPQAGDAPRFSSNVLVSKHAIPEDSSLTALLSAGSEEQQQQDPSYQQLDAGTWTHEGQDAAFLDTTFFVADPGLQLFQRRVAVRCAKGEMVVFTITSDKQDLAALATKMGLVTH